MEADCTGKQIGYIPFTGKMSYLLTCTVSPHKKGVYCRRFHSLLNVFLLEKTPNDHEDLSLLTVASHARAIIPLKNPKKNMSITYFPNTMSKVSVKTEEVILFQHVMFQNKDFGAC